MAGFEDFYGQDQIITHLKNAIQYNKISHAYTVSGEDGMGKKMLAKAFAMTLQCERGQAEPCMECRSCRQAMSFNHPDIRWVTHEKSGVITVDEIRAQVNGDIGIKPYSSPYKIYIIDEAQKMNAAAQNALLKTIEEPPAYGVIMLLTANSSMLLPTIQSRCVELSMKPLDNSTIKEYLMKEKKIPEYQAEMAAAFAGGNPGKAVRMAQSEDFAHLKEDVLKVVKSVKDISIAEVGDMIKRTEEYKLEIDDYFDMMRVWYRDILIYKASMSMNEVIFKDEYRDISRQAEILSYNGLENILEALDKAKVRLKANVNFELVIELLYLTIREMLG